MHMHHRRTFLSQFDLNKKGLIEANCSDSKNVSAGAYLPSENESTIASFHTSIQKWLDGNTVFNQGPASGILDDRFQNDGALMIVSQFRDEVRSRSRLLFFDSIDFMHQIEHIEIANG